MTERELMNIRNKLVGRKIVFCDFFETIIRRKHSNTLFFLRLKELVENQLNLFFEQNEWLQLCYAYLTGADSLAASLNALLMHVGVEKASKNNVLFENAYALLEKTELEECTPCLNAQKFFLFLKKENIKLIIISDYYGPASLLEKILKHCFAKIPEFEVFCSADEKMTKAEGLIRYVSQKQANLDTVMIGDNFLVDILNAKNLGLDTIHLNSASIYRGYQRFLKCLEKKQKKNCGKLFVFEKSCRYFANFQFSLFSFVSKIYRFANDGETVYFLSREGQFLKKLFDLLKESRSFKKVDSKYVYVSRNASFLLNLDVETNFNAPMFSSFFHEQQVKIDSLSYFMHRLGFSDYEIQKVQTESALDLDEKITNLPFSDKFEEMIGCNTFQEVLRSKILECKRNFIKQFDLSQPRILLVDVGWKGTSQDRIRKVFPPNITLEGLYFGYTFPKNETYNSKKHGLEFEFAQFGNNFEKFGIYLYLEDVLRANHGEVLFLSDSGPLFEDDVSLKMFFSFSSPIQEHILLSFKKLLLSERQMPLSNDVLRYFNMMFERKLSILTLYKGAVLHQNQVANKVLSRKDKFVLLVKACKMRMRIFKYFMKKK